MTQAELAKVLKEPQQNVAFWEYSDKPPRSDVLPRLAQALGVSVVRVPHGVAVRVREAMQAHGRSEVAGLAISGEENS